MLCIFCSQWHSQTGTTYKVYSIFITLYCLVLAHIYSFKDDLAKKDGIVYKFRVRLKSQALRSLLHHHSSSLWTPDRTSLLLYAIKIPVQLLYLEALDNGMGRISWLCCCHTDTAGILLDQSNILFKFIAQTPAVLEYRIQRSLLISSRHGCDKLILLPFTPQHWKTRVYRCVWIFWGTVLKTKIQLDKLNLFHHPL